MLYGGIHRPVNLVHVPAVSLQRVLVDSAVDLSRSRSAGGPATRTR